MALTLTFATMRSPLGTLRLYAAMDPLEENPRRDGTAFEVPIFRASASPTDPTGMTPRRPGTAFEVPVSRASASLVDRLVGVYLPESAAPPGVHRRTGVLDHAEVQLAEYFAGRRREFTVPLAPRGTAFQRLVWASLLQIPCGETRSYGELARAIGRPAASRAVGAANGRNPISIIIPCHRLIGASGDLTGYGGGLAAKRWLLDHERAGAGAVGTPAR